MVAGKYRIGREQKNNLYKIIGSNRIKRIANIRMERSGLNSDPVFSDQDEHSDNVSVRSSSKLLLPLPGTSLPFIPRNSRREQLWNIIKS